MHARLAKLCCTILLCVFTVASSVYASSYYGPTTTADRLYRIALAIKPSEQVSVGQTMVAIFEQNKHAFKNDNMNNLYSGLLLAIPSVTQIAAIDPAEASRLLVAHNTSTNQHFVQTKHAESTRADLAETVSEVSTPDHATTNASDAAASTTVDTLSESTLVAESDAVKTMDLSTVRITDAALEQYITQKINQAMARTAPSTAAVVESTFANSDNVSITDSAIPAELDSSSVPQLTVQTPSNYVLSADINGLQGQLHALQLQLSNVIEIIQDSPVVTQPEQTVRQQFAEMGLYTVSEYLGRHFSVNPVETVNPHIQVSLALLLTILIAGMAVEMQTRRTAGRRSVGQSAIVIDHEEDEYDYIESEEGIPAKLNLARAYCDMGHPDKARSILTELTARGDNKQREEARNMLLELDN